MVIKIIESIVKWGTGATKTIIKTSSNELIKTRRIGRFHKNHYYELESTPFLYGSDYIKELANNAIKNKNEGAATIIYNYILKWKDKGFMKYGDYDKTLVKVKKFLSELDITDFL